MTTPRATRDWERWHDEYDNPESWQYQRLAMVRECIHLALTSAPPGRVRVIAMCAGQGRDLLPVLREHRRRRDVDAWMVELDPRNADRARKTAADMPGARVAVITGDAALTNNYLGAAPADLLLMCGVFPHISTADIQRTLDHARSLTKRGGLLVWTHRRTAPDEVPQVSRWLDERGFREVLLTGPKTEHAVGMHQHDGDPPRLLPDASMFTFVGVEALHPGSAGGAVAAP